MNVSMLIVECLTSGYEENKIVYQIVNYSKKGDLEFS